MKPHSLQTDSASSPSSAPKPTEISQPVTAIQLSSTRAAVEIDAHIGHHGDGRIGQAYSSSTFKTLYLLCDDLPCLAGTAGSATKYRSVVALSNVVPTWLTCGHNAHSTDSSSSVCLAPFWPSTTGAPDLTVFTMVDSSASTLITGQGIVAATALPQAPTTSPSGHSGSSPLLKPPAGTVLEVILGATVIFVLVIISCVIIARKVYATRTRALRVDTSRSSLTVSALAGEAARESVILLPTRPGTVRSARENKTDRLRGGDMQCDLEAARGKAGFSSRERSQPS